MNPYKHGWHTTWNGKTFFYRSSYELCYAQKLDLNHTDYEMEKPIIWYWDSVLKKKRTAFPDFHLIQSKTLVEIKSRRSYNERNVRDKFETYESLGYRVVLLYGPDLKDVTKEFKLGILKV